MRSLTILGFLLSSIVVVRPQAPQVSVPALEVTVVDRETDAPLVGADIAVARSENQPGSLFKTATDSKGRFDIENLAPGRVVVGVALDGYEVELLPFTLEPGQRLRDTVFRLRRARGVITGRVVDASGQPLIKAQVLLHSLDYNRFASLYAESESHPHAVPVRPGTEYALQTNDLGVFRGYEIASGGYLLEIPGCHDSGPKPYGTPRSRCPGSYASTLYPGVSELATARRIEVRNGEETRLDDIRVQPPGFARIRAHLENGTGRDLPPGIQVYFTFNSQPWRTKASARGGTVAGLQNLSAVGFSTGNLGMAIIGVNSVGGIADGYADLQGKYHASVFLAAPLLTGDADVEFHGSDVDVYITVIDNGVTTLSTKGNLSGGGRGGRSVVGRVLQQSDDGVQSPLNGVQPFLLDEFQNVFALKVDAAGAFSVSALHDGHYTIGGFWPGTTLNLVDRNNEKYFDHFILDARQSDRDVLRSGIDVSDGTEPMDLIISPSGAAILGTVTDANGQPIHNAVVALIPDAPLTSRPDKGTIYRTERTDQNGHFAFRGMVPGAYRAYAWRENDVHTPFAGVWTDPTRPVYFESLVENGGLKDPQFMQKFESYGKPVVVAKSSHTDLGLQLIPSVPSR